MRAVIYNRCSTEEEAQINALDIQAAESREIVNTKGWTLVDQYIESESGTSTQKRTEYQRLLEDMELDKFDVIVIKSIDRLMRSTMDWYLFIYKLTQYNKKLYMYIDSKFYTPDESLINGLKAILAEEFSRELSKKIKNAHRRRQTKKSGINITRPMFGWNKVSKNVFEINEDEAYYYRLAYALVKDGMGFYRLAKFMYDEGVRGKDGKRISETQWRKMLFSTRAYGTVIFHTKEYDFEAKRFINIPEENWIYFDNALPPIISKEYYEEVMKSLKERTIENKFVNYSRDMSMVGLHELSGKLICSECGAVFYRSKLGHDTNTMDIWKCSTAFKHGKKTEENIDGCNNIHLVEETILKQIEEACKQHYDTLFGYEENIIDETLNALKQVFRSSNHEKELEKHTRELEKLEKKKTLLFEKLMDEVISDSDFIKFNNDISEKIESTQSIIEDIKNKMVEYNDYEERLVKIKESLAKEIVTKAKTKELIARIKRIVVYPDKTLEIEFDKLKILSLISVYTDSLLEEEVTDKLTKITITYEHKFKMERDRESMNKMTLDFFRENPEAKLRELVKKSSKSESYVNKTIRMLKDAGLLRYERYGNHTGKWIVTEQ